MFSGLTFGKGPVVLDRLRRVIGDSAFFLALRRYTDRFAYGTVTTRDFETVAERAAGRSLDGFFRE
jgi:aminopeptidase N